MLLCISRLSMLAKDMDKPDEGIFSQNCYLCSKAFSCLYKPIVCSLCGYMFCSNCAPRTLVLGTQHEEKRVCVVCEFMYRFVYKTEDTK